MPELPPLFEDWRLLPITPGPLLLATLLALITLLLVLPQPLRPLVEELDDDEDEDEDDDDEQDEELAEELDDMEAEMGWWPLITVTSERDLTLLPPVYSSLQIAESLAGGDEPLNVSGESDR